MARVTRYLLQVAVAFDQLLTAILGGWADETLSSYAWRMEREGKLWGVIWRPMIDWLFGLIGQDHHCENAYAAERARSQLPPELRA